ncbi:MAG: hypothetical protein H7144_00510 [Burkholderiales bacterium]|nr:hypothetical protein [Phycisphaerae bacterium]
MARRADRIYTVSRDSGAAYTGPQWQDNSTTKDRDTDDAGDFKHPIAYRREATMKVDASFSLGLPSGVTPNGDWIVKGDGPASYDFYRKWGVDDPNDTSDSMHVAGGTLYMSNEAAAAFPNWIDHFDTFDIAWTMSFDNGATWHDVGTTKNQVYTLLEAPRSDVTLYHTVAHLATGGAAKGQSDPAATVSAIFSDFSIDDEVRRVDGTAMVYDPGQVGHTASTPLSRTDGHGQCSALADLLHMTFGAHGISSTKRLIAPGAGYAGLKVADATVLGPTPLASPSTEFSFHVVVETDVIADRVFDASFGVYTDKGTAASVEDQWEASHVIDFILPGSPKMLVGSNPAGSQLVWTNW